MSETSATLTAYDAVYVALAELLDAPLPTCDGKIASALGHYANVECRMRTFAAAAAEKGKDSGRDHFSSRRSTAEEGEPDP